MSKMAFVFSGQGAQIPGMGKELYECSSAARKVLEMVEQIRPGTTEQCFYSTKELLSETIHTQPCLFAVDLAAAEALKENAILPDQVAGFSLGEIPALAFAGVLDPESAFRLVCKRAEAMQYCAEKTDGAMAAVIGLKHIQVEEICMKLNIYPVNYNFDGQLVIAGERERVASAITTLKEMGGRVIPLPVNGAFHTPFMDPASEILTEYCDSLHFHQPTIPIYSNSTGELYPDSVAKAISNQVRLPVRWKTTIENMAHAGVEAFIEVGVGKTLCGFIKKIIPTATVLNVENKSSLEQTLKTLNGE